MDEAEAYTPPGAPLPSVAQVRALGVRSVRVRCAAGLALALVIVLSLWTARRRRQTEPDHPAHLQTYDMTRKEDSAFAFSQELLDFAIELVTAIPMPPVNRESPRDPLLIGAALLCRSITNFRGALVLARENQPVESRALIRLIYENFFCVGALCEGGADFVKQMRSDEAANRKTIGELSIRGLNDTEKDAGPARIIRTQIRKLVEEFPKPRKFGSVSAIAGVSVANSAYLSYAVLSMDGHPSITALRRHLQWEREGDTHFLTLNVAPRFKDNERTGTIKEVCTAMIGVCVGVNQLAGGTSKNEALLQIIERFEALGL
jgi:hypothetical protein